MDEAVLQDFTFDEQANGCSENCHHKDHNASGVPHILKKGANVCMRKRIESLAKINRAENTLWLCRLGTKCLPKIVENIPSFNKTTLLDGRNRRDEVF